MRHFPDTPRVDDRRVISGIVFVIKGGRRWREAPPGYGPHKTLYNRFMARERDPARWIWKPAMTCMASA